MAVIRLGTPREPRSAGTAMLCAGHPGCLSMVPHGAHPMPLPAALRGSREIACLQEWCMEMLTGASAGPVRKMMHLLVCAASFYVVLVQVLAHCHQCSCRVRVGVELQPTLHSARIHLSFELGGNPRKLMLHKEPSFCACGRPIPVKTKARDDHRRTHPEQEPALAPRPFPSQSSILAARVPPVLCATHPTLSSAPAPHFSLSHHKLLHALSLPAAPAGAALCQALP